MTSNVGPTTRLKAITTSSNADYHRCADATLIEQHERSSPSMPSSRTCAVATKDWPPTPPPALRVDTAFTELALTI